MTKLYVAIKTAHGTPVGAHVFTLRELANAAVAAGGEVYECELDRIEPGVAKTASTWLRRRIEEANVDMSNLEAYRQELRDAMKAAEGVSNG